MINMIEDKTAKYSQVHELKALLNQGARPSYKGEYNYTGLMWAAVRGKTDLAKVLLDAGADTEAVNAWGRTALFIATWEGHTRIVIEMVHAGANVSSGADHDEWTALHKASEMGNSELVRILLEAGADPTHRTLPDKSFPTGVTAMDVTGNEQVKRMLGVAIEKWANDRASDRSDASLREVNLLKEEM